MARASNANPMWKEPFVVSVEGNIGAGKSTLMKLLAQRPMITALEESVDHWKNVPDCPRPNNLLQLFYETPTRYAASFQTYAMVTQHGNHMAPVPTPVKVIERSLHSSFGVFTELLAKQDKILPIERAVLQHLYTSLKANTDCTMHCVVYIEVPTSLAAHRISWRGRAEERQDNGELQVDTGYLQRVNTQYDDFLRALPIPVIRVDGNNNPKDLVNEVLERLSELCPFIESPNATN